MSMLSSCHITPRKRVLSSSSASAKRFELSFGKLRNVFCFFVAACYIAQFFWTLELFVVRKTVDQLLVRDSTADDPPNTNWNNVQYNNGVFGEKLSNYDKLIRRRCFHFLGYRYVNYRHLFASSNNCFGPVATNTTCCYCFLSRDGEQNTHVVENYKYWSCAVARENSLLPLNSTRVDTKGGRIIWITGKLGHGSQFKDEVDKYCNQVKTMRLFEPRDAFCYWDSPEYVLRNKKFERHLRYRTDSNDTSAKGAGFWFHKSVLVRHHMDTSKDGDFIVYTDVDRIDFFELGTFNAVVETVARRGDDLSIDVMGTFLENAFTKEDLLTAFNASKTMRESAQVSASWIVLRNSPKMKRFIDAWIECVADWHMVSDEPSVLPNAPGFKEHRHDQSILGLLIKSFMINEGIVGPPARPFGYYSDVASYRLKDTVDPTCPFSSGDSTKT